MKIDTEIIRPIRLDDDLKTVKIIDQRRLPHEFVTVDLKTMDDAVMAIIEMYVRGAPLIGVTAAYGVFLAALNCAGNQLPDDYIVAECRRLKAARPTAVNLSWAVDWMLNKILTVDGKEEKIKIARRAAGDLADYEAENCRSIGKYGLGLIEKIRDKKNGRTVNLLTHCNAGWLACIEYGTATAPMYAALEKGIDIHVWVDETRPLNQGSRLTAWELGKRGIKHTVITDNAGGHLMQHGMVDLVIVGTDRTSSTGDVANKIGTYLKALAARDNDVPFYVALPSSTFDWRIKNGVKEIPIEKRDPDEVRFVQGLYNDSVCSVLVPPETSPAANFAFDVTPARLVTGFITERGICRAEESDIKRLFPENY
ncbi:MAG: S-methyl-5-thioribose-1-phosphate isomerase [Desulfobacteraceae bacterium 4572_123]|nr:MAG: S-methyl-5-thioribose-1-phosphate isomerase [Desulfobacteraceae bacterium 4572_123]